LMTGAVIGEDRDALLRRAGALAAKRGAPDGETFLENAGPEWIAGTVDEVVSRLKALEAAGVERVMLQHLSHEDVEVVALIGRAAGLGAAAGGGAVVTAESGAGF